MPTLTREIEIAAPAHDVWALLEDVRRLPEFSPGTEAVTGAPERLTAVGDTYTQVGTLLGKRMTSRWRVVAIDPGHRLASEGSPGLGRCARPGCRQGRRRGARRAQHRRRTRRAQPGPPVPLTLANQSA